MIQAEYEMKMSEVQCTLIECEWIRKDGIATKAISTQMQWL